MAALPNTGQEPAEPQEPQTKRMRAEKILFGEEENKYFPDVEVTESGSAASAGSCLIPTAAGVFRAAGRLGVHLSVKDGFIEWRADQMPPHGFLVAIAAVKPDLIEILRGDRCRWCGDRLAWPGPAGITFADSTSECMACVDREVGRLLPAGERAVGSHDAMADDAEIGLDHGGHSSRPL